MITDRIQAWLQQKWTRHDEPEQTQRYNAEVVQLVHHTFSTLAGQATLKFLMDDIYCRESNANESNDAMRYHQGRRSVVHDILEILYLAEHPPKEETDDGRNADIIPIE